MNQNISITEGKPPAIKRFDWENNHPFNWPDLKHPGVPLHPNALCIHVLGPLADGKHRLYKWVPKSFNPTINAHWEEFGTPAHFRPSEMESVYYVGLIDDFLVDYGKIIKL